MVEVCQTMEAVTTGNASNNFDFHGVVTVFFLFTTLVAVAVVVLLGSTRCLCWDAPYAQ